MLAVLWILFAYLLGSVPVGILLARIKGADPRKVGSGNIGATNVMRTAGKAFGIITLIGDILKGLIPILLAVYSGESRLMAACVGFSAFIGHLYPVYLKFKGGKGVATALGIYIVMSPFAVLIDLILFIIIVFRWRYISLGSLVGAAFMPLLLWILSSPPEYIMLSIVMAALIFFKHTDNIKRLISGTENKMGSSR